MVVVPTGANGDIITISGLAYNRGGPSDNNPAGDLLRNVIDNTLVYTPFNIAAGNDVLGAGGVDDIKSVVTSDFIPILRPSLMPIPVRGRVLRIQSFD